MRCYLPVCLVVGLNWQSSQNVGPDSILGARALRRFNPLLEHRSLARQLTAGIKDLIPRGRPKREQWGYYLH
ncbi:hypothetical protein P167DRAFT_536038 [Morchella conica CCBAS932]|uniref:Uncharacterized protein n=1 Tax=Morchella conica CCBAS932 TaxID=1392247 RepID=A0A3N4L2I2_9PEZI|nr:hypothetical protein P167DRAFT_536038 [Morchella conica CCBAS932]